MKAKQSAFIMLLFSILIFACACSKKQTRIQSNANVNIEKLTWNDNVEKYEMDTIKYLYKKSSDGKYVRITKVEVSDKHTSNQLKFPEKINESILVCVGFDSDNRGENTSDVVYNVFGDSIMDGDDFQYSKTVNKIHSVVLPDSVCSIEDNAFAGLYSLEKINCPKELKKIGAGAFELCSGLTEFDIEKNVSEIGLGAFGNCEKLSKIHVSADNDKYCEQGGLVIDKKQKQAVFAIPGRERIMILNGFESFRKGCFATCRVKEIDLKSDNVVFAKKGNYIYRKDKKALAVGVVNGNTAVIPEGIEELNQDSVLIGQNISKVTMPSSLKCLRGAWIDMGDLDDCVFEFKSANPPKIAAPSKDTSMVPVGQKIYVPRKSIKLYKKWLKQNGEKSGVINYK